ncbi:hypothetical protein [Mesorhizobium sp. WSM4312]|uniref:hypothetical protein n=1 Tax=Mesorhizobium sp. WSM4312 TaxID=2029411 RepID=UPI0015CEF3AE|nr:hypothetical protein [Mesorhizobium sp. WSM4312]
MTAEGKERQSSTCGLDRREPKLVERIRAGHCHQSRNGEGGQNDENSREVKEGE